METMKQKLSDITLFLDWSEIAEQYFNRTPQWMYQRLSGNIVNGKPAAFKPEEKEMLKNALLDLSRRLVAATDKI